MSDFYNKYPYTDFHELNLDWVIERVKKLTEDWLATQEAWQGTEEQWQQLHNYVMNYFANLDVQDEINNKINDMILDGTFLTIITPTVDNQISSTVSTWLADHITPTTPPVDRTLSILDAAADAWRVGYLAAPWYDATATYKIGDTVLYDGYLFRAKQNITTPETFNYAHWTATNITKEYNKAFQPRKIPVGTVLMASLLDQGVYPIEQSEIEAMTDIPSDANGHTTSTLINFTDFYSSAAFVSQYLIQLDGRIWNRLVIRATQAVYFTWKRVDNIQLPYAFQPRTVTAGTTTLISLLEQGVYHLEDTEIANITDLPADALNNAVSTLINITDCYGQGAFVYQYFLQLDGRIWKRLIYKTNSSIWQNWSRFDLSPFATKDILYGKKLVTAGDSYTQAYYTGAYASYNGKNFGWYIADRNNMTLVNDGISGSTMALPNDATDTHPFSDTRYTQIPVDTDYLTIWFGINDYAHCDLGTIDDATNTTFYGAWNVVLNYYLTNRPFMKVLLVVTTGSTSAFRQAVRDIAEKWGYPYLDWEKDVQIPAFFDREGMSTTARDLRRNAFGYNDFYAHPNPEWHEYASSIFESKLRSI